MKYIIFLLLFVFSTPGLTQVNLLSDNQKKELALFGMKAMGLDVSIRHINKTLSIPDIDIIVATGLNLNGHLCAKLITIRPMNVYSTYVATCITYRAGTRTCKNRPN